MMRSATSLVLVLLVGLSSAPAQKFVSESPNQKVMKFDPDSVMLVREIGALIGNQEGVLRVLLAPPPSSKVSGVQRVDLATGDEVGMAGGRRIHEIGELRKLYDSAAVGSEFKLGVRREGKPIVVTFTRKSPEDLASGGMMMITREGPSEEGSSVFPALGFRLTEGSGGLTVSEALGAGAFDLKTGDTIRSLNGKGVHTLQEFEDVLGTIEVGQNITIDVLRGGKEQSFSANRPEPRGTVVRIK